MKANQVWNLDGQIAATQSSFANRSVSLTIDNRSPAEGAKVHLGNDEVSLFAILSADQGEALSDLYVRGNDLIARYHGSGDCFDRELYWRVLGDEIGANEDSDAASDLPESVFALEMIFSLQTDLLNTRPNPCVITRMKLQNATYWTAVGDAISGKMQWQSQGSPDGCQLVTAELSSGARVAVAVYPTDLTAMELETGDGEFTLKCRLDAEFLEKGVIRRTRLFAALAGSDVDQTQLMEIGQRFLDSELPLTT
jgi:hypothetical protein